MANAITTFTKQDMAIAIVSTQENMTVSMLTSILKNPAHCPAALARKKELASKVIELVK